MINVDASNDQKESRKEESRKANSDSKYSTCIIGIFFNKLDTNDKGQYLSKRQQDEKDYSRDPLPARIVENHVVFIDLLDKEFI